MAAYDEYNAAYLDKLLSRPPREVLFVLSEPPYLSTRPAKERTRLKGIRRTASEALGPRAGLRILSHSYSRGVDWETVLVLVGVFFLGERIQKNLEAWSGILVRLWKRLRHGRHGYRVHFHPLAAGPIAADWLRRRSRSARRGDFGAVSTTLVSTHWSGPPDAEFRHTPEERIYIVVIEEQPRGDVDYDCRLHVVVMSSCGDVLGHTDIPTSGGMVQTPEVKHSTL